MSDDMTIEEYLASGGVLTSPTNVPARYRAEVMRLMAVFIDSELAGAAGFADMINAGPGVKERIAAARIVLEKTHHAEKILRVMGEFGANTDRYANHHPWTERLPRDAPLGAERPSTDMRLVVFNYPFEGWADAVVMNLLMGQAVVIQMSDLTGVSYQPLSELFKDILPVERRHAELAEEGIAKLIVTKGEATLQTSVDYWWPRVAASFGTAETGRDKAMKSMGLRSKTNDELTDEWTEKTTMTLAQFGLNPGA